MIKPVMFIRNWSSSTAVQQQKDPLQRRRKRGAYMQNAQRAPQYAVTLVPQCRVTQQ